MDYLEKNWKHHAAIGAAAVALGLGTDKILKHKTVNVNNFGDALLSFIVVGLASMGADFVMSDKQKNPSG